MSIIVDHFTVKGVDFESFFCEVTPETNLPDSTIEQHLIITKPFPFLSQHNLNNQDECSEWKLLQKDIPNTIQTRCLKRFPYLLFRNVI